MVVSDRLSEFCVYTMRHRQELDYVYAAGGRGRYVENKPWVEGRRVLTAAQATGRRVPLLLSAADVLSGIIYLAVLDGIEIHEDKTTTY